MKWYLMAAEQRNSEAQLMLRIMIYMNGFDVSQK